MKKLFIHFAILLFATSTIIAQNLPLSNTSLASGWQRVNIKNVGSIDIPPTMEIQGGTYKEFNNKLKSYLNIEASQLTLQQKSLNDFNDKSFEKYVRVILNTTIAQPYDFERLNFNIYEYTSDDLAQLTQIFKESFTNDLNTINQKILSFYPVKLEQVNGMSCIHIKYTRQLYNNPPVMVNYYIFQNHDRMHELTLSYRMEEANYWKNDLEKVLTSFRITNIK